MQKIKKAVLSLIIVTLIFNVLPFKLFAENSTYYIFDDFEEYYIWYSSSNTYTYYLKGDSGVRFFIWKNSTNNVSGFIAVSQTTGNKWYRRTGENGNITNYTIQTSSTYNGVTYYVNESSNITLSESRVLLLTPVILDHNPSYSEAIYYTFGEGAVDPTEPTNYGELIVGFHTNFSASGTTNNYTITSNTNLDTIEWKNVDSNGNDLQNKGLNVQIRAVPILYTANSKSALDLLGFQDAVVNYNDGLILWTGNFNDNKKSFIWNDVINQLQTSNPAFAITSLLTGSVWTRYGWIYQIRYNDVLNSYSSEWQTIYNSTSITVSDSEKIVNQYYYTYPSGVGSDDQDIFHDINTVNNTNNTWYVNEVPVDPDASWLDALIQAIAEILGKILDFFSSIFDGLVDLILGLFGDINPAESFFNWFSDLFNGIHDIDLTLPQFNLPNEDLSIFQQIVQATLDIFNLNNLGFVIFIPLLLLIIRAVL